MNWLRTALRNPVAGNLLFFMVIVAGLFTFKNIHREMIPEFDMDIITITVTYRGATPEEVEESIISRIEESITGVEGIDELTSTSSENMGSVVISVLEGYDTLKVKEDIEKEVDQILTFPTDAERPIIMQLTRKAPAIFIGLFGAVDQHLLKDTADEIRDEILIRGLASQVSITGLKDREISIELSEEKLQTHNLTFQQVSNILRSESLDMPGGTIKSPQGEILVRTAEKKYTGEELSNIPIITDASGTQIRLGDIATIADAFQDIHTFSQLNNRSAAIIKIEKTSNEDIINIVNNINKYVETKQTNLPPGLEMVTWGDSSQPVKDRLNMLTRNGIMGLCLVFLFLCLFMEFKIAIWVSMGIPFCFMGTFIVMGVGGFTLNMISMFALIIVLGIVVDDAMVVSESIFTRIKKGNTPEGAALKGTLSVYWPVIAAVSTTIVAFLPFYFVKGMMGKFMGIMPTAVISMLIFSLVESLFILPAHLKHAAEGGKLIVPGLEQLQLRAQKLMDQIITVNYPRLLKKVLINRYITAAIALAVFISTIGLIAGQRIKFDFFPEMDQELLRVTLEFPTGTDAYHTLDQIKLIGDKLYETQAEMEKTRKPNQIFPFIQNVNYDVSAGKAVMVVELVSTEFRNIFYRDILAKWRTKVGRIPDSTLLTFSAMSHGPGGSAVDLQIRGNDAKKLEEVRDILITRITEYPFVTDIENNFKPGKLEAQLVLKPLARTLGFRVLDVAQQVRRSFFGDEALRIQRGNDDIRVYIRYPKKLRDSLNALKELRIRNNKGEELPFSQVADFHFERGFTQIHHAERQREITIKASIDNRKGNDAQFREAFEKDVLVGMRKKYPDIDMEFRGRAKDMAESVQSLFAGLLAALLVIYCILATIFGAYLQPLIIMAAIPLGFVGAVFGHMLMGFDLTMLSLFGFVALSGVVVNDSLLLIEFINRQIRKGTGSKLDSCIRASQDRFMAIFLTTMTTFLGVTPMLLETSRQARFLQPMVISLGFGVMAATVLTLFVIPALYLILDDIIYGIRRILRLEN